MNDLTTHSHSTKANKLGNEYADLLGPLYAATPKAVLAAIVVDLLAMVSGEAENFLDDRKRVQRCVRHEWRTLHEAGIIPQGVKQ